MGSRQSPSRRSSFSYAHTLSRRSSLASNPDVFSDDYALEPIDSRLDLSLQDSIQPDQPFHTDEDHVRDFSNVTPYPAIPSRLSVLNRPGSTSKRPMSNDNTSAMGDAAPTRTLSTSSRFSIVRSQSPYSGPTQPSHPYAMYPQVTRASSIASASTFRPQERPFVPVGGPEHPYSLYPQNTVAEDSDDDIGTQPIPLGFPTISLNYQRPVGTSNSDVGDIVGTDGHIEQLPPYTRYADNVVAKGDMAEINRGSVSAPSQHTPEDSNLTQTESTTERMEVQEPSEREILLNGESKKETWREKAHKRVCGGIALWLLVLIIVLVVFAGVVGGMIGGIVGRRQGTDQAKQSSASAAAAESATTVTWYDADPVTTGQGTPTCPTGRYVIPFKQTEEISSCVADVSYGLTWNCMDFAFLGINVANEQAPDGTISQSVRFDDYSVAPQNFTYGPQPPDFNGTKFPLSPYKDRDDEKLGVALFFAELFDKLSILPPHALDYTSNKRSVDAHELYERGQQWDGRPLSVGDQPWYCFWNQTVNEFWIFLEGPTNASTSDTPSSTITSTPTPSSSVAQSSQSSPSSTVGASVITATSGSSTHSMSPGVWSNVNLGPSPTPASIAKRGAYTSAYLPVYPKLVKMVEKRKPEGNTQPYCQKMQVLNDWQIVPLEENQIVFIMESNYATNPVSAGSRKRRTIRDLRVRDTTSELQSNCVCEWMSI